MLVKMEELKNMIKYVLWSGYVKDEEPLSLLIISKPESGKTDCIKMFKNNKGVIYFNDVTPWGLVKNIYKFNDLEPVRHVMIPDLLNPMSKSQTSVRAFIQFMNSAIEEGIEKIQTYGIQVTVPRLKFGLITAITSDAFKLRRHNWSRIGFLSRMIPFSYSLSRRAVEEIMESIFNRLYQKRKSINLNFPKEQVKVDLSYELARKVNSYAVRLATAEKLYGFRHQKQFQTLLQSIALSKGKRKVDEEDYKDFQKVAEYINLDFNAIR